MERKFKPNWLKYIFDRNYRTGVVSLRMAHTQIFTRVIDDQNVEHKSKSRSSTRDEKKDYDDFVKTTPSGTKIRLTLLDSSGRVIEDFDAVKN